MAAAAAEQRWGAETEALRQRLAAAEAATQVEQAWRSSEAEGSDGAEGSPVDTANAVRWTSSSGGGSWAADSGRQVSELPSEEVTWGRTLTGRAPAARPKNVPPVDLSRLRLLAPPPVPVAVAR